MANEKISQMPAAAALTGSELAELVQAGVNVQTTASAIAGLSPPPNPASVFGNPNGAGPITAAAGTFGNFFHWVTGHPSQPGGGRALSGLSSDGTAAPWTESGAASGGVQGATPAAATLGAAVCRSNANTSAAANSGTDNYNTVFNVGANTELALYRKVSGGLPIAGFTMTAYFCYATVQAGMASFVGLTNLITAIPGTQVPSALLNSIGLSKDIGDTNLQFLIVNGSAAAKTDTGISMASLAGHLLKLVITCDSTGNCVITLTDLETGGASATHSYPTATANLPVQDIKLEPHLFATTGSATSAITFGVANVFMTAGFIA